jgi:hypothetical protein
MNPYLENPEIWGDFHQAFISAAREALAAQVDPDYVVRIDAHIYLHEPPHDSAQFFGRSDVAVSDRRVPAPAGGGVSLVAPAQVTLPAVDVERISFLEIRDRRNRYVVTVVEVLSPSNKHAGADRDQYLTKRGQLLASRAHFVEIDLLRGGPRMPMHDLPACDYYAMVSRVAERWRAGVWPIRLHDPLPTIPIPLSEPHGDASLDLQATLHRVYDAAKYETDIYDGQPQPSLSPDDAVWARQFVPAR